MILLFFYWNKAAFPIMTLEFSIGRTVNQFWTIWNYLSSKYLRGLLFTGGTSFTTILQTTEISFPEDNGYFGGWTV